LWSVRGSKTNCWDPGSQDLIHIEDVVRKPQKRLWRTTASSDRAPRSPGHSFSAPHAGNRWHGRFVRRAGCRCRANRRPSSACSPVPQRAATDRRGLLPPANSVQSSRTHTRLAVCRAKSGPGMAHFRRAAVAVCGTTNPGDPCSGGRLASTCCNNERKATVPGSPGVPASRSAANGRRRRRATHRRPLES